MLTPLLLAIVAVIAVPHYQDSDVRARWQATVAAADDLRIGMALCYQYFNSWNNTCTSLPALQAEGYTTVSAPFGTEHQAQVSVVTGGWDAVGAVPAPGASQPAILLSASAVAALNHCDLFLVPVKTSLAGQIKWLYAGDALKCMGRKTGARLGGEL